MKTASVGNDFAFYVPKSNLLAKVFPAKKQPNPSGFIKSNFKRTSTVPFGTRGALVATKFITIASLLAAALECGYGRRAHWTSQLMLSRTQCAELAQYLASRLELVFACVEQNGRSWQPRSFYEKVEASEKVTLSFILGGLGAYLAAHEWVKAGGTSVKSFLHVGIYAKSSAGLGPLVTFAPATGKSPDFLVETQSRQWHVFEAKRGRHGSRWSRLCEGLTQLDKLPPIGLAASGASAPATTKVCVHTGIDAGNGLSIMAVDPPGKSSSQDAAEPFLLIEGAYRLLLIVEAIQLFNALSGRGTVEDPNIAGWTFAKTSLSEDIVIGIPTRFLKAEKSVRRDLGVFLAVREFLERMSPRSDPRTFGSRLRRSVRERLRRVNQSYDWLDSDGAWLGGVLEQFSVEYVPGQYLIQCANVLALAATADGLALNDEERKLIQVPATGRVRLLTSGGLLLSHSDLGLPDDEILEEPTTSRG